MRRQLLGERMDHKGTIMRSGTAMLMALAASTLAGCAEFDFMKWKKDIVVLKATPQNPAVECLCIWQPAEGRGVNGLPTRGFAGSIMFFTHKGAAPVEVDGDVRIYQFDNMGTAEDQARPLHQFDFAPEVWKAHMHQGMLGPSYQVFVPYMRKGGHQAECALRVRLQAPGMQPIYSEMVSVTLPGTPMDSTLPTKPVVVPSVGSEAGKAGAIPLTQSGSTARPVDAQARLATAIQEGLAAAKTQAGRNAATSPGGTAPTVPSVQIPGATDVADRGDARLDRLEAMLSKLLENQPPEVSSPQNETETATPEPEAPRFRLAPARSASTSRPEDEFSTSHDTPASNGPVETDVAERPAAGDEYDWWSAAAPTRSPSRRPHPLRDVEPSQTAQLLPAFEPAGDPWAP